MTEYRYFELEERRKIERMHAGGASVVEIVAELKRSPAAIYTELARGYTGELDRYGRKKYSAELAQRVAARNFRRRGIRDADRREEIQV